MGFLERLNEITKPKILEAQFDFGAGPETVYFRALSAANRQRIIQDRLIPTKVKDKDGNEVETWNLDFMKDGTTVNAELLEACLCDENGKTLVKKDAILTQWDGGLVQRLGLLCLNTIQEDFAKSAGVTEDPSKGQS